MKSSKDIFSKELDKAFSQINLNSDTMQDLVKYKGEFTEEERIVKNKKKEPREATGSGSSGAYTSPLFSGEEPKKVEAKEATGSASSGAYATPAAWAKSTSKKHWRGKSKTQIPGGSFVSVKKKCKTFPYCNQGDIKALNLYEKESVKEAIKNVAEKLNLNENVIKAILEYELELTNKRLNKDIY